MKAKEDRPLSDAAEILRLMKEGWELGYGTGFREAGQFWLQKNGLCRGGETRNIHASTARSMFEKGLIKLSTRKQEKFWLRRYELGGALFH